MKENKKLEEIFTSVFQENKWADSSSFSGPGSNIEQTKVIRNKISELINFHKIKNIVDAPCGDFFWMKDVIKENYNNIDSYIGFDIVDDLIQNNINNYSSEKISFKSIDLTHNIVPKADLIICRDCFLHLSYRNIYKILKNFKHSGTKYLLASTYVRHENKNIYKFSIQGRAINLGEKPFKLSSNLSIINEEYHGQNDEYNDKSMILIDLSSINTKHMNKLIIINEIFYIPRYILLNFTKAVFHNFIGLFNKR